MSDTGTFKERLRRILGFGIEHTHQHTEDLRNLSLEARTDCDAAVAEGLLEAAELSRALALKMEEVMEKIR